MSEQELNSILNEIKSKGKNYDEPEAEVKSENINFQFNSKEREVKPEPDKAEADAGALTFEQFEGYSKPDDKKPNKQPKKPNKKNIIICAIVAVIVVIAIVVTAVAIGGKNKEEEPTTTQPSTTQSTTAPVAQVDKRNPLTGETNFANYAVGRRPVAVVVENEYSTESVRPQWGLADADIVLEGESEYSTRLLLFWADYTKVPEKVGPARSARPPFIRFSAMFDSVFLHAGLSHSRGDYVGAGEVFGQLDMAHVNLLHCNSDYFRRDKSRTSTIEHTGYLVGTNVPKLIKEKGYRKRYKEEKFTHLQFNEKAVDLSSTPAKSVTFRWTSPSEGGRCPKTGNFTYNESTKKYTTTDFDSKYGTANVEWENLIFLLDTTNYIVKENYKDSGSSETYCDYELSGGKGMVVSNGTALEIQWGVENGKLFFRDKDGNDVKFNPGKSYIGYGSSNHGGSITIE